ncbi:nuclear transcription factor Y subunit B-3-like [Telopea speciosissima]|uniref:nuclear transcription factor Y subunit B-3-like n=1 Tax=Telopea speciosissima TaxID=54955 RepID=UPI001CC812D3|nr:nuclear transcription factor Y subunit B-3-like [Telopea speciosissima]
MTGRREQKNRVRSPPSESESGTMAAAETILDSSKDQDQLLPIANVSRIMKKSLPTNAKISKEAKETVQECASEFISFITGEASDKCQREKRKTINGDDLLWAMTTLGFENYSEPLKVYLNKYRETEGEKNTMARQGDQEANSSNTDQGNLPGFSSGFYSLGAQLIPQKFRDEGKVIRYG